MTIHVPCQWPKTSPCRLAFVGEAPGEEEEEKRMPFCGPSGRVFNSLLRTAGIERSECYVGNVFDEKLPGNEIGSWCMPLPLARTSGWTGNPPPIGGSGVLRPEHGWHLGRLAQEMEKARPTVIVPLGGTALWAFTATNAIGEVRGAAALAQLVAPNVKVMPTYHPAAVMREWKLFSVVVGDLIKAVEEAERGPGLFLPSLRVVLEPSMDTLLEWDRKIMGSDLLSVDIETGWGFITCIGFAPSASEALVVPFVDLRQPDRCYWRKPNEEREALELVKRWMESDVPKLGQNFAAYDAFWLLDKWGIRPRNCREDTRILHHSLYPELPKSLAFMGASYTDQGPWKLMRGRKGEKKED